MIMTLSGLLFGLMLDTAITGIVAIALWNHYWAAPRRRALKARIRELETRISSLPTVQGTGGAALAPGPGWGLRRGRFGA